MQADPSFIENLLTEINKLRASPVSFGTNLKKYKQDFLKYYSYKTKELEDIVNLTGKLNTFTNLPALQLNDSLTLIADDFMNQLKESSGMKFYAQDEDYLTVALSHEIDGFKIAKNFLNTEETSAEVLMAILFNGQEIGNDKKTLLNGTIRYIGVSHQVVKGKLVTITIFTDGVKPAQPKGLNDGLISEISRLRSNPKSYIKYLPQNDKNIAEVIALLQKAKRIGNLVMNKCLTKVAKERAEAYDEDSKTLNYSQLVDYLAQFCDKYLNVAEYIADPQESARDFVIQMLMSKGEGRNILFNRKYQQIGMAQLDSEKPLVLLFADNAVEKNEKKEVTILSFKKRLHRPKFTEDELVQMQNDFKSLDVANIGLIKPEVILLFADKNPAFATANPFYHTALKSLNTEENNSNGVDCNEFINAVKKAIRDYDDSFPENWPEIYNLYFSKGKKKTMIDKEILANVVEDMGFKVNNEDVIELLEKIDGDLNQAKFVDIMRMIELRFAAKEAMIKA